MTAAAAAAMVAAALFAAAVKPAVFRPLGILFRGMFPALSFLCPVVPGPFLPCDPFRTRLLQEHRSFYGRRIFQKGPAA
jgi:hypothetical protein